MPRALELGSAVAPLVASACASPGSWVNLCFLCFSDSASEPPGKPRRKASQRISVSGVGFLKDE